jgi:putative transposase
MCLPFMFLLTMRLAAWLRLSRREETWKTRREETWKTAEILILRHQLTLLQRRQPRRPNLNWADRALLATLLSVIPKARRHGLRLLVAPGTILRWHRNILRRWAARSRRGNTGRPATRRNIRALVLRLARENPEWGLPQDPRRAGRPGRQDSGVDGRGDPEERWNRPAPRRTAPTWSQFLRSPAEAVLACDFFTADLLDGTQTYVLAVIEHATRRIRILGVTRHPTGEWTTQQARNLLMDLGEQTHRVKFMIRDRGPDFTAAFDAVLADAGVRTVLRNVRTPRMNAIRRTLDRGMPPRAAGPRPHLEPGPSAADLARLRDAPQSAPAAPLPARRRAAETATRAGRSRSVPCPKTHSRQWADQRISPGRMTWTRFSARTGASCRRFRSSRPRARDLAQGPAHHRQLQRPPDMRHRAGREHVDGDDQADGDHGRLPPVTPGHLSRRRRLIPVSALSLHSQLETSNGFLETVVVS